MPESGYGRIRLFNDFCGPEIPIATAVAYGTTAGGCNYRLGDFTVHGDLADTACGVIANAVGKVNGWARLCSSATTADGQGIWVGTELDFSPALNGALAVEVRLELPALTARNIFVVFMVTRADAAVEPVTLTGSTLTKVATDYCGFVFDSQLTASTEWHGVYSGGSTTGPTDTTEMDLDVNATAAESQVLRVEIDSNGTARWYIDGALVQTVENAVSTTARQAGGIGIWSTTNTTGLVDADYLAVEANRDWTV